MSNASDRLPRRRGSAPVPAATRLIVLRRANGHCEDCERKTGSLELHHLHYETVGEEEPDDLRALCRGCHLGRHLDMNGEFWADPMEMESYWEPYFEEMVSDDAEVWTPELVRAMGLGILEEAIAVDKVAINGREVSPEQARAMLPFPEGTYSEISYQMRVPAWQRSDVPRDRGSQ